MAIIDILDNNPLEIRALSRHALQKRQQSGKATIPGFYFKSENTTSNDSIVSSFMGEYSSPVTVHILPRVVDSPVSLPETPTHTQVRSILEYFALSKSDLAKILGVTRPTLYAWLEGHIEPKTENTMRLLAISSVIEVSAKEHTYTLFHPYIERPVSGYPLSLIEALSEPGFDIAHIRAMVAKIRAMTEDRAIRIGKDRPRVAPKSPMAEKESWVLEDNLSAIGSED